MGDADSLVVAQDEDNMNNLDMIVVALCDTMEDERQEVEKGSDYTKRGVED